MNYYKATRTDGTSFFDKRVKWEVGKWTRIPKEDRKKGLCGRGILHCSDAPAETLVGGSWPCRLFLVKPTKIVSSEGHKHGAWGVKVLEELPAWQALGPKGEAVAAFIERAGNLTPGEARRLDAGWGAARGAAWNAAWIVAWDAAWNAARGAARGAAWNATWHATRDATRDATWDATWDATRIAARDTTRDATWIAARDTAGALVVKDLIIPEQFDILYGPWAQVIGQ
jgi:hypothetical protein